jgi:hypothetical protein
MWAGDRSCTTLVFLCFTTSCSLDETSTCSGRASRRRGGEALAWWPAEWNKHRYG